MMISNPFPKFVFPAVLVLSGGAVSDAATIFSDPADASVSSLGTVTRVNDTAVVTGYESSGARSSVFVFQLPTLAAGESFAAASFGVRVVKAAGAVQTFNLDLYGLGFRTSSEVLASDYFSGTLDVTDAILLEDSFFTPTSADGNKTVGAGSLTDYLNLQALSGGGGNFVFLRASADVEPVNGASFYYLGSNTNTTYEPRLTFTIVPEPGAAVLAGAGVVAGLLRRRRDHTSWVSTRKR